MEYDQRVIIRFLCKERVSPEEIHPHLEAQLEDATYSERSIRRWRQYVRQGCENLHDKVRSGRPPIDFPDIRILVSLDEESFHSVYSVTEALCVSDSTILSHFLESLGMKIFICIGSRRGSRPVGDRFRWKLAQSY
jgi:hypothetical protein